MSLSFSNPTPDSSHLPKWHQVKHFPVNYYRLGNFHFEGKPTFGMENGIFEDRAKFWRDLGLYSKKKYPSDDQLNVFLKHKKSPNSAIKSTSFTWIGLIGCTFYSVLSMKIIS